MRATRGNLGAQNPHRQNLRKRCDIRAQVLDAAMVKIFASIYKRDNEAIFGCDVLRTKYELYSSPARTLRATKREFARFGKQTCTLASPVVLDRHDALE